MFLFSKKHKTPVSTYTDSYRPPYSVKKAICDRGLLEAWKENKFVTPGLTVPPVPTPAIQIPPELMAKAAMQEYYRNTIDPVAYGPGKYWLDRSKGTAIVLAVHQSHTGHTPMGSRGYPCASINMVITLTLSLHSGCSCACTMPVSIRLTGWLLLLTLTFPHYPCASEKAVVTDMLHKVPVYTMTGRIPFQNYYIPCSGRHCCLRGIDYYLDGTPATRKKLFAVEERPVPCSRCSLYGNQPCPSPLWDTGLFTNTQGVQRGSYTIHPEFVSEDLYASAY
uniref:Sperm microtubule inner protein 6 n=1 Tax=Strigops habroptila TaxID=2489341 RepID=A0A672V8K6_STRHB